MLSRLSAFVVWALVAATAVFWGLRLLARPQSAPAYAVTVGEATTMRGDLSRLFGSTAVASGGDAAPVTSPELASRFKLLGIMAPKADAAEPSQRFGFALIAVDGKPPRTYAVGSSLDSGLVLQSVSMRTASIGPADGAEAVRLEMPPLPEATTGTLPPLPGGAPAGAGAQTGAGAPIPPSPAPAPPAPQAAPVPQRNLPGVSPGPVRPMPRTRPSAGAGARPTRNAGSESAPPSMSFTVPAEAPGMPVTPSGTMTR